MRSLLPPLICSLLCLASLGPLASGAQVVAEDPELEALLQQERDEADRMRRQGEFSLARRALNTHLREEEGDAASRVILGLTYLDEGRLDRAERHLEQVLAEAEDPTLRQQAARGLVRLFHGLGRDLEASEELIPLLLDGGGTRDPRSLFWAAEVLGELGRHDQARELYRNGASAGGKTDWRWMLASARCLQRLGRIEQSGNLLLRTDALTRGSGGRGEADVLVALGDLFFEADREVEEGAGRSAVRAYDDALRLNPAHEGALLGLFDLHRVNWMRHRRRAGEFLQAAFELRPNSVNAHLATASRALRIGKLPAVRAELEILQGLAPARRDVRSLEAALAWVEHDRDRCRLILAELQDVDPADSRPERKVGKHLLELYRFAEALPFLEQAVKRDATDYHAWTHLANALANVGDEAGALEALRRSRKEGGLRQDAWRKNMTLVLERLEREYEVRDFGELSFAWKPDAAPVLEVYLEPFYREAREELAQRYGFTPSPTHIEVFRRHRDFSVRSTGFEGFPALGVCFGPVVTALSPISELRGSFSWARTSFHEFTHVIHLGLSHNRCPRWITEGLATWEEANNNPAWERNLRRDLVDSHANGTIFPVRDLNGAFRGPRIIFGYYQGGLICEMLIERYGFSPLIRLLEAFDQGLDLDQALARVFELTPEELDRALLERIDTEVAGLHIEPRWDPLVLARKRLGLAKEAPAEPAALEKWTDDWCTQAWGAWQQGRRIDAEESLRRLRKAEARPTRALFLRGEMARLDGDLAGARGHWERGLKAGGEDFQARIFLGDWAREDGENDRALEHYLAAELAFPGFDDTERSAEMKLVALYIDMEQRDQAMLAAERYLRYDAGSYNWRRRVADWHMRAKRFEQAATLLHEANEIDPFSRALHLSWGTCLEELGRDEEALREYGVVGIVPVALDLEAKTPLGERALVDLLGRRARCLVRLGRLKDARSLLTEADAFEISAEQTLESVREARELLEQAPVEEPPR